MLKEFASSVSQTVVSGKPGLLDWISTISAAVVALGVIFAAGAYFIGRRQIAHGQLQVVLSMRARWEERYIVYLRGLAVMTWFVFPDREGMGGSADVLGTKEEEMLARETAFQLAYYTAGPLLEYEIAVRHLYAFLVQLSHLRDVRLVSDRLLYAFFGRDLLRFYRAIKGFVLNWPPSENFPHQRDSIVELLESLFDQRRRLADIPKRTLDEIDSLKGRFETPPDVSLLLQRSEKFAPPPAP